MTGALPIKLQMTSNEMRQITSQRHAGFTLTEMLVVIAVIALLIALLLPALNRARDSANTTRCLSNLRQLASAVNIYVADSHGYLPPFRYQFQAWDNRSWMHIFVDAGYMRVPVQPGLY